GALRLAFTTLLQRKGRVLDALSENRAALLAHMTVQDQKLLDTLDQTTARLARLVLSGPQGTAIDEHQKRIASLERDRDELEAEISRQSTGFYQAGATPSIEAVRAALPSGSALVEFAIYRPPELTASPSQRSFQPARYVAYILRPTGEISWKDLGEAAPLDEAVERFRAALRDPNRRDVDAVSRAVDQKLMQPIRPLLGGASHLLISPDGQLSLIPFAALLDENRRFLVERYSMSYLTSGSDLLRPRPAVASGAGPLVIADPLFGEPASSSKPASNASPPDVPSPSAHAAAAGDGKRLESRFGAEPEAGSQSARTSEAKLQSEAPDLSEVYFAPLGPTAEEAKAIGALFPDATILTGARATKEAIKQSINHSGAPRILHIATHGFFLPDRPAAGGVVGKRAPASETNKVRAPAENSFANPLESPAENPLLRSGLALAGANFRKSDRDDTGILTALEASGLNLWGSKLVVLSACDTGVGQVRNGEGVYGLRRAFVLAGAEALVMSLWPVSDYVTRELMIAYYKNLNAGLGRSESLRRVQLEMLGRKNRRHPFYWASFIQSGDWRPLNGRR
ncbi:MAG TPA: CHAT domain-containing protein, partial [Blastocatellia bacterium]|nr:CHAT domain-containing protein [Blastocatellia bacterium]